MNRSRDIKLADRLSKKFDTPMIVWEWTEESEQQKAPDCVIFRSIHIRMVRPLSEGRRPPIAAARATYAVGPFLDPNALQKLNEGV